VPARSDTARDARGVGAVIPFGSAFATWAVAWTLGSVVLAPIVVVASGGDIANELTIPQLAGAAAVGWAVFLVALVLVSRRFGSGDPLADLGVRFRPIDLVGVPLGVLTQVALIPLVYLPLRQAWPGTFGGDRIEQRAQGYADRAGGALTVLLVVVVVVGAPLVEELVYRGLLQRSLTARVGVPAGVVLAALFFAVVHLTPIEFPGLFAAALVFGGVVAATGRIGPSIVTHAAFNAAGIVTVLAHR
jgi:membrane protease YdiL (CAAX protease family)